MNSSPLACLSPELRNAIYEFVFTSDYAITLKTGSIQHAFTKTCRQARQETLEMYYSLARLNAHLDDMPATPLAQCMKNFGREHCLLLREVNVWDMHMLNATLHGEEATRGLLARPRVDGEYYVLRPIGSWLLDRGWYLKDLIIALHEMGLALQMFCLDGREELRLTSKFAIIRTSSSVGCGPHSSVMELLAQLGFSDGMQQEVLGALGGPESQVGGKREIRVRNGRRDFFLRFDEGEFVSVRQTFVPHDEEYLY